MFQRFGNLENHVSTEKCTTTLEKHTLLDLAKMGYKSSLEDNAGVIPTLKASKAGHEGRNASPLAEDWVFEHPTRHTVSARRKNITFCPNLK
jgi:hypothetical protein